VACSGGNLLYILQCSAAVQRDVFTGRLLLCPKHRSPATDSAPAVRCTAAALHVRLAGLCVYMLCMCLEHNPVDCTRCYWHLGEVCAAALTLVIACWVSVCVYLLYCIVWL
jgi:hypothetical protein